MSSRRGSCTSLARRRGLWTNATHSLDGLRRRVLSVIPHFVAPVVNREYHRYLHSISWIHSLRGNGCDAILSRENVPPAGVPDTHRALPSQRPRSVGSVGSTDVAHPTRLGCAACVAPILQMRTGFGRALGKRWANHGYRCRTTRCRFWSMKKVITLGDSFFGTFPIRRLHLVQLSQASGRT